MMKGGGEIMSHETDLVVPLPAQSEKVVLMPLLDAAHHPPLAPAPTEKELQAVEALFAAKERESAAVAGLLSLWTGTMLLNDLAMDAFSEPAGEVEPEMQKPKEKEEK
jgi:hypothetical protein